MYSRTSLHRLKYRHSRKSAPLNPFKVVLNTKRLGKKNKLSREMSFDSTPPSPKYKVEVVDRKLPLVLISPSCPKSIYDSQKVSPELPRKDPLQDIGSNNSKIKQVPKSRKEPSKLNSISTKSTFKSAIKSSQLSNQSTLKPLTSGKQTPRISESRTNIATSIKDGKVFGLAGNFTSIRNSLKKRGWVEKFDTMNDHVGGRLQLLQPPNKDALTVATLLVNIPVKFYWTCGSINWSYIEPQMIVNRFPFCSNFFCTKTGLTRNLVNQHWTYKHNVSYAKHPKTFPIVSIDDMVQFENNYRISACMAIVLAVVEESRKLLSSQGQIPLDTVDFAIQRICEWLTFEENADLDIWDSCVVSETEWALFLLRFYQFAHYGSVFMETSGFDFEKLVQACALCISKVEPFWPDLWFEGTKNLWIIKPGASSCGRGVRVLMTLKDIQNSCKKQNTYILQKYIERPMLIHNTKFDIRQWFLVTSITPLVIWMYQDCYLRFSSQLYSLKNMHESVHLCNNSVQYKYKNEKRDEELPEENMWDKNRFLQYLEKFGQRGKWDSQIYPMMRQAIVGALLASQEYLVHRSNSFSLYGADFMLTDDFVPWLIEINSSPCMRHTTSVTTRLCVDVLEDVCKVVLDKKENASSSSGKFTMIYKQKMDNHVNSHNDLLLAAKKLRLHRPDPHKEEFHKALSDDWKEAQFSMDLRSLKYEEICSYKEGGQLNVATTCSQKTTTPLLPGSAVSADSITYTSNDAYRLNFMKTVEKWVSHAKRPESAEILSSSSKKEESSDKEPNK